MDESRPVEVEVQRYAGVLRRAVRAAGFSVSEIERRLGTGPKALRRVFGGSVDLKLKHVIAVLRIIGMPQEEFFALASRAALRPGRGGQAGGELLAIFERLGYRGDRAPDDEFEKPPSAKEFDRQVEEAVDRLMRRRAREGKPGPATEPPPLDQLGQLDQDADGEPGPGAGGDPE